MDLQNTWQETLYPLLYLDSDAQRDSMDGCRTLKGSELNSKMGLLCYFSLTGTHIIRKVEKAKDQGERSKMKRFRLYSES